MHIITDFGTKVQFKNQILHHRLHGLAENSEILSMLEYGEENTQKSVAYLLDLGAVVGFCYIEHFPSGNVFGIFIHPDYRGHGHAIALVQAVRDVLYNEGYLGKPVEVDPKVFELFQKVFGKDYSIEIRSK